MDGETRTKSTSKGAPTGHGEGPVVVSLDVADDVVDYVVRVVDFVDVVGVGVVCDTVTGAC